MKHLLPQLIGWFAAVLALWGAARLLLSPRWIAGWLRGSSGMLLLGIAFCGAVLALDIRSYQQWPVGGAVATINFEQLAEQHFVARLTRETGVQQSFELYGDQWQVDVRILNWTRALRDLGIKPVVKLDRLSTRYLVLEEQLVSKRSEYPLGESIGGIARWSLVRTLQDILPWYNAEASQVAYLPMSAKAEYQLQLKSGGLTALAQNAAAVKALAGQ